MCKGYKEYLEHRHLLEKNLYQIAQHIDKSLLYLSAGALGISLAFIGNIIPKGKPIVLIQLLVIAWICFGASILSVLFASFSSQKAFELRISELDKQYSGADNISQREVNKANNRTDIFNYCSMFLFTAGVILLAYFTICNL